jgi:hypothetical protein
MLRVVAIAVTILSCPCQVHAASASECAVGAVSRDQETQTWYNRNMTSHNWIRALLAVATGPLGSFLVHADEPASIEYTLTQTGQVSAAVYDSGGRLVRTLLSGAAQNKGAHRLTWDGLDRNGRPMPIGNYVWKVLRTPGFRAQYVTSLGINPGSAR